MLLSEEKITHLSHLILNGLARDQKAALLVQEVEVLREIKRTILSELRAEEGMDRLVRAKLASYSRPISEGSPEWEVLYQKFISEERQKRAR